MLVAALSAVTCGTEAAQRSGAPSAVDLEWRGSLACLYDVAGVGERSLLRA